jgi:hypothetical protein
MLQNSDLFTLIKSLDLNERRYLVTTGRKETDDGNAYVQILQAIASMEVYSEVEVKSIVSRYSVSEKTDVKKHYLFFWILRRLHNYHATGKYKGIIEIGHVKVLIDRSLYQQASRIIPAIKKRLIESEHYPELLMVLEIELQISMYTEKSNPALVFEDVQTYSKQYANLKTLQMIRYKLRRILDLNIFTRNEADKKAIEKLTSVVFRLQPESSSGLLLQYNYNLILYWKFATANNWSMAFQHAYRNYQLMCSGESQIRKFPDETIHSFFNVLNSSFISEKDIYNRVLKEFRKTVTAPLVSRIRNDYFFFIHLSQLIHFNRNFLSIQKTSVVKEAFEFIQHNRMQISRTRLNNFYFDLAKSLFYQKEYKLSFTVLNDIYQNLNVPGHTRDFYTHSRILFCLSCFENNETDLMRYSAKSAEEYMKRNSILYRFEKRFTGFIVRDLFRFETMKSMQKLKRLEQLNADLIQIFESPFERTVLNYFDYQYWINEKLEKLKTVT